MPTRRDERELYLSTERGNSRSNISTKKSSRKVYGMTQFICDIVDAHSNKYPHNERERIHPHCPKGW